MTRFLKNLIADEEGATMVEYALMIGLVGAALVGIVTTLGKNVGKTFTGVGSSVASSAPSSSS